MVVPSSRRPRRTTAGCGPRATRPRRWRASSRWANESRRHELERHAVVAIALAGRLRAVVEDVALVALAARAMVFGARHDQQEVGLLLEVAGNVVVEARPAGAALELGLRPEERQVAA